MVLVWRKRWLLGGQRERSYHSLTSLLIPVEVATLKPAEYRDLRESHTSVRSAFKGLTAELARINRLNRIEDPKLFGEQVEAAAREFFKEYQPFRNSRYARGFKRWAPLYVGGLLSAVTTVVAPHVALVLASASLGIQVIQKKVEGPADDAQRERIFNMVAGMRKDIFRRSGIKEII